MSRKVTEIVTLPVGWVKVYVPSPLSVTLTGSPLRSVTVTLSTSFPWSGLGVMVTVSPLWGRAGATEVSPPAVSVTVGG